MRVVVAWLIQHVLAHAGSWEIRLSAIAASLRQWVSSLPFKPMAMGHFPFPPINLLNSSIHHAE